MQKAVILILVIVIAVLGGMLWRQNQKQVKEVAVSEGDAAELTADTVKAKKPKKRAPFVNWHIDSLAVHKAQRQLLVFSQHKLVKEYRVALGINPVGKKEVEGDYKTPEGLYHIDGKNPFSQYYKSLGVSYPNEDDRAHAKALGQKPGGDIKIHGLMKHMNNGGKNHIKSDWTWGCIAVTNEEIDELFQQVKVGTPIYITP
jgi:murein L,D-transpeptidase YafK